MNAVRVVAMAALGCAGGACAAAGPGTGLRAAHAGRSFERAVIPAMTTVYAVAANDRFLFVASPSALGVLDRRFGEWLPPLSRVEGWPAGSIDLMLADPLDLDAVWMVGGNVVYRYRVGFEGLVRSIIPQRTPQAGSVFIDGGDPAAGLIIRTSTELRRSPAGDTTRVNTYVRVSPTGLVQQHDARRVDPRLIGRDARGRPIYSATAPRYAPETPADIAERYPALRGFERLLTQDASLRTWPVLSAASHPNASQVWFGTGGGGVFQIDPLFTRGEQMPYGLLAEGAGAIALGADGVWIGGAGVPGSTRDGLTFVDHAMRTWRWVDGGVTSPFAGARATGISVFGSLVWVATTRGVVLVNGQNGAVIRRWDALSGLPSDVALAVEATRDGAWVGTTRGLVFITDDGRGSAGARAAAVGPVHVDGRSVYALARRGDTVWVASDLGVLVQTPDSAGPRRLRAAQTDSRLSGRVVALATADTLVVVATDQGDVLRINVRTGSVLDGVSLVGSARGGLVSGVAIDSLTIWVASSRAVTIVERATGRQRVLGGERELAGEILGVALTPEAAWIATDIGAVRFERLSDGMVR